MKKTLYILLIFSTLLFIAAIPTLTHNKLDGLQGGQTGQYYHLTEANYTSISNWDVAFGWGDHASGGYAVSGGAEHDGFSDFVANEHIDWTLADQGTIDATNIQDRFLRNDGDDTTSGGLTMRDLTLTFGANNNYFWGHRAAGDVSYYQNQVSASASGIELFSKDGDGTDVVVYRIWGRGTPDDLSNSEYLEIKWNVINSIYKIFSGAAGGTIRPLVIETSGHADQIKLNTDGSVSMSGALGVTGDVTGANLNISDWDNAYTHISNDGTDHSYIDQDLQTSASPGFAGLDVTGAGAREITVTSTDHITAALNFMRTGNAYTDWRLIDSGGHLYIERSADDGSSWTSPGYFASGGGFYLTEMLTVIRSAFPVVNIVRQQAMSGLVYGGVVLKADDTGTSDDGQGIGFYFKVNDDDDPPNETYAGMFGGALADVSDGAEIGEIIFGAAYHDGDPSARRDLTIRAVDASNAEVRVPYRLKVGADSSPANPVDIALATEDFDIVDAGSTDATEQDWVEVLVGGNTGYIRVYAAK